MKITRAKASPGWQGAFISAAANSGLGEVPEWLKGTDCKSVGFAYAGSNPVLFHQATPICHVGRLILNQIRKTSSDVYGRRREISPLSAPRLWTNCGPGDAAIRN